MSQPGYRGTDFPRSNLNALIRSLHERRTRTIYCNGLGETTMVRGWADMADELWRGGFRLRIISNLARALEEEEVTTLARFEELRISCDTTDPELFRRLRRYADLETVWRNQDRVRQRANELGWSGPKMAWSTVVCDRTVFGLPELVREGIRREVRHFTFCNLVKCADLPGTLTVSHVSTLGHSEMVRARAAITAAYQLVRKHRRSCVIQAGLLEVLDAQIRLAENDRSAPSPVAAVGPAAPGTTVGSVAANKAPINYSQPLQAGFTRLCLDPWNFAFVSANGDIRACCIRSQPMGNLRDRKTLTELINDRPMRELREQLLSGKLASPCDQCPARRLVPLRQQRDAVRAYLVRHGTIHGLRAGVCRIATVIHESITKAWVRTRSLAFGQARLGSIKQRES